MTEENKKPKVAVLTCDDNNARLIAEKIKDLGYEVVKVEELKQAPIDEVVINFNEYMNDSKFDKPTNDCWWQKFEKKKNRKKH